MRSSRYPEQNPLRSEESAWEFLDWLRQHPADADIEDIQLGHARWAWLQIHYTGSRFNASLTPAIMEALLTLQSGIHRSYALAKYGDERISRLTSQDRRNTEITVQVEPGTTGLEIDGTKIATHFIDVVGHTMNGTQVTVIAVLALVLFFGLSGFKLVLAEMSKNKSKEIDATERAAERAQDVRSAIALSQEETKRLEILKGITESFPKVVVVQNEAARVSESMLRSLSSDDTLDIQGVSVPGPVAADILTTPRSSADLISIKSTFQIISVDSSSSDGFRARLRNVSSDEVFSATLKDLFLSEREGKTVQEAFWRKRLVFLEMDARLLRGQIKDAEILKASILEQSAPE